MLRVLLFLTACLSGYLGFFFVIVFTGAVIAHWTTPVIGMSFEVIAPLAVAFLWERRK